MVDWYKHDIPAWMDATASLDAECYRTYHVIIQLIMQKDGPIRNNEKGIAGLCNQHILTYRKCLKKLLDEQKLRLTSGRLHNDRAATELQSIADLRATSAKGGRSSGEVRRKSRKGSADKALKDNDPASSPLPEIANREEKKRGEKNHIGANAPLDDWPADYRDLFWKAYPNKVGKPKALAKLDSCRKRGIKWQDIIDGLFRYLSDKPADRAWLNPETFINQERWADQPALPLAGMQNGKAQRTGSLVDSIKRELDDLEREDEADPPVYPSHIRRIPR